MAGMVSALLVFALWIGGTYSLAREVSARTLLWAIPIGAAALFLAAPVRLGFLALAFARAGMLPRRSLRRVFAAAAALGLLVAILLLFSRRERPPAPSPQPSPRSAPLVVLAVDVREDVATVQEFVGGTGATAVGTGAVSPRLGEVRSMA